MCMYAFTIPTSYKQKPAQQKVVGWAVHFEAFRQTRILQGNSCKDSNISRSTVYSGHLKCEGLETCHRMRAGGVEFNKTLDQGIGNSFWKLSFYGVGVVGDCLMSFEELVQHKKQKTHKTGTWMVVFLDILPETLRHLSTGNPAPFP